MCFDLVVTPQREKVILFVVGLEFKKIIIVISNWRG